MPNIYDGLHPGPFMHRPRDTYNIFHNLLHNHVLNKGHFYTITYKNAIILHKYSQFKTQLLKRFYIHISLLYHVMFILILNRRHGVLKVRIFNINESTQLLNFFQCSNLLMCNARYKPQMYKPSIKMWISSTKSKFFTLFHGGIHLFYFILFL